MKLDEAPVVLPSSFTVRLDLLASWGDSPSRTQIARLCAATVALCLDLGGKPPVYDLAVGDVHGYGAKCLDWLVGKGFAPGEIYKRGTALVGDLSDSIPTEAEVDDQAAGFPDAEDSTD